MFDFRARLLGLGVSSVSSSLNHRSEGTGGHHLGMDFLKRNEGSGKYEPNARQQWEPSRPPRHWTGVGLLVGLSCLNHPRPAPVPLMILSYGFGGSDGHERQRIRVQRSNLKGQKKMLRRLLLRFAPHHDVDYCAGRWRDLKAHCGTLP